ncbi:hypothetical protein [Rhodococcus jostii]|uniref:hypothetical protein n=1 Tax=Rhodococcus jostii TaxID=132919 RepID=UPI00365ACE65
MFLLVLAPGEWIANRLLHGIKHAEETSTQALDSAASAVSTAEDAKEIAERAEGSLSDVRSILMERQEKEYESELDLYRGVSDDASRSTLITALRTATDAEILSENGVRVSVWETDLHYRFVLNGEDDLEVRLETDDCTVLSSHTWGKDDEPPTFYQTLVEAVRAAGEDLGVLLNDPTESVERLSKMLVDVANLRSQALMGHRSTLRRIIQKQDFGVEGGGWYFTERAILPERQPSYEIAIHRLNEMDWGDHLRGKGWYEADLALDFARKLYSDKPSVSAEAE